MKKIKLTAQEVRNNDLRAKVRLERARIRRRYMDLSLYPDEYSGTEEELREERYVLLRKIRSFRYRSLRNFINEVFDDASHGIYDEEPIKVILKGLRGYRDRISWEEIASGHQLTVNGLKSPWVDIKLPAEIHGYIAFREGKNKARIVRAINVCYFTIVRD
jgi:hypothetical protein